MVKILKQTFGLKNGIFSSLKMQTEPKLHQINDRNSLDGVALSQICYFRYL